MILKQAGFCGKQFVNLVMNSLNLKSAIWLSKWQMSLTKKDLIMHYLNAPASAFEQVAPWKALRRNGAAERGAVILQLDGSDPDGMAGVDPARFTAMSRASFRDCRAFSDGMTQGRNVWCIAGVATPAWAKKVFPGLSEQDALERLWDAILATARADGPDPAKAWAEHDAAFRKRIERLNARQFDALRYTAANGTDFPVGMLPEAQFRGGGETSLQGIFFNPNIPTEECFISPMRGVAEGIVYATKPLSYQGQLISGFWIRFHEGKAVEWHAEQNGELLTKLIEMDEGSRYLGECALVPFDSPINQTGLLFYNTLFDENACCHLALGMGFADTIRDFQNKTLDECRKLGVNDSMIHEDFMIGSADLAIDAVCEDGKTVAIFRDGTWAF